MAEPSVLIFIFLLNIKMLSNDRLRLTRITGLKPSLKSESGILI